MILRLDLLLWSVAAVLALAAGIWYARAARRPGAAGRTWLPMLAAGLALLALVAGLSWRLWPGQVWPGADGAEGLVLMTAGALLCDLWQDGRNLRHPSGGRSPAAAWTQAVSLAAVACLIGVAVLSGGSLSGAVPALQADGWLLGLRNVAAGLGLGGWLFLAAGALYAAGRSLWRLRRQKEAQPSLVTSAEAAGELREPVAEFAAAAAVATPAQAAVLAGAVDPGPASRPRRASDRADFALRFSYPWLTAALLLGGLWSVSAYATPWRGQAGEIWLAVTWLVGAAYLHAVAGWQAPELPRAWAHVLAVAGVLAALLAAWHMPALAV